MLTCLDCGRSYRQSVWNFGDESDEAYGYESIEDGHELATYSVSWVTTCPFCGTKRYAREVYVLADVMFGAKVKDDSEGEE